MEVLSVLPSVLAQLLNTKAWLTHVLSNIAIILSDYVTKKLFYSDCLLDGTLFCFLHDLFTVLELLFFRLQCCDFLG